MRPRLWAVLAGTAALALLGWLLLEHAFDRRGSAPGGDVAIAPAAGPRPGGEGASKPDDLPVLYYARATDEQRGAQQVKLPPLTMPAAQVYEQLLHDAETGSARAACRIAAELYYCHITSGVLEAGFDARMKIPADRRPPLDDALVRMQESSGDACAGVTPEMEDQAFRFQQLAFRGGDPDVQRWVVSRMAPMPGSDPRRPLDPRDVAAFHRLRFEFVRHAMRRRDLNDLIALANITSALAYREGLSPAQAMELDAMRLALKEVSKRHGIETYDGDEPAHSARVRARAAALTRQMAGAWKPWVSPHDSGPQWPQRDLLTGLQRESCDG